MGGAVKAQHDVAVAKARKLLVVNGQHLAGIVRGLS